MERIWAPETAWRFFDNLNEVVYISDPDTYELLYMNRKAMELCRISSWDDVKGKPCYEVLQRNAQPCKICTNSQLQRGEFVEWKYYNPIYEKTFLLKDTLIPYHDKLCRLEMAVDISVQEEHQEIIEEYINNELMLNDVLQVALSKDLPEESIEILLEHLGATLHSERVYIFERTEECFSNTYEWCAMDVTAQKENLQNIPLEDTRIWLERFQDNKNVVISHLEDIKDTDPVMYGYLLPQNIHSLVVSPIFGKHNQVTGFFGVDNPPAERLYNISILLQIMGHFLASLLRRRDLIKRLEVMSFYDQLTGCGNRHAMNQALSELQPDATVGLVYGDVTGLKHVNDTQGHQAGDALLVRASASLKRVFADYSLFRVGGDEFLILCTNITEAALLERVELLRKDLQAHGVRMALGTVWHPDSRENMDKLLTEADERMYENKRAYYSSRKLDRRRCNCEQSAIYEW